MRYAVFGHVKDRLSYAERRPFAASKAMFCKAIRNLLIINEITICKQRAKYKCPKSVIQVYYKHREAREKEACVFMDIACKSVNRSRPALSQAVGNCHAALRCGIQKILIQQMMLAVHTGCRIGGRHDSYRQLGSMQDAPINCNNKKTANTCSFSPYSFPPKT